VIEQLFTQKMIKIIFTTETFALGINMPARTVVLDDLKKRYGRFYRILKRRDFFQMAGRSGRRGIDKEGFVYSRINPDEISFQELKQVYTGRPEPILSRFNISYATILSLFEKYGDKLIDIYPLSFHFFQQKNRKRNIQLDQIRSRLKILYRLGYLSAKGLTTKGEFAKKMYGYELPLSELFGAGLLETLTAGQLALICLSMVYEPRPGKTIPGETKAVKPLRRMTRQISGHIHSIETGFRIKPLSKKWFFDLAPSLLLWMDGKPFDEIMVATEHDEGEVIRFYRMCLQILREIKDTPVSVGFKPRVDEAIGLINRDVINAEEQLKRIASMDES
jgi:superfamily II RNA helicase